MSEQRKEPKGKSAGTELPPGWDWADWESRSQTVATWNGFSDLVRASFSPRFEAIRLKDGRLPHEKFYVKRGIGMAKIAADNPGWRAFVFRDGQRWLVTHFRRKDPKDNHEADIATALEARRQHLIRSGKRP